MEFSERVKLLQGIKTSVTIHQTDAEGWGLTNFVLRDHQIEGIRWLIERYHRKHGCILGDEMGLGKTLQSLGLILYLTSVVKVKGPILVLCPLSVINNWESEFKKGSPLLKVMSYCSGKEDRQKIQQEIEDYTRSKGGHIRSGPYPFTVLLAHYEVVLKDTAFLQKIPWSCLIVDEGHRLKNSESILYQTLQQFRIDHSVLLTGTPVQNNLNELYSLLSFVSLKTFPLKKLDRFTTGFANVEGDTSVSTMLHTVLEPFILRRTKSEVLLDIPMKSEVLLYTGLSSVQRDVYKAILTKDLSVFGSSGTKTSLMNVLMNLRKCVNHPYLFNGIEPEPFEIGEHLVQASGKLFVFDKLLELLKSKGHRVLVFSQMTRMLDILQDYLTYRGHLYERLDGSVRGEERFLAIKNFSENEETFVFLLSTRAGGQGLNLVGADTVIFMDSDFNPQNDLQAAARAHRIGQTKPVKIVRLIARETVEEIILKRSEAKLSLTQTVIEGGQLSGGVAGGVTDDTNIQLADILKYGLDKILNSDMEAISDLNFPDLESVLGQTDDDGKWVIDVPPPSDLEELSEEGPENMYIYEGKDYSGASDKDRSTFDQLLGEQLKISEDTAAGERVLRSETKIPLVSVDLLATRKRKPLTEEQLAERKKKREENRLKRQKMEEERERKREEEQERMKQELWRKNRYTSLSIFFDDLSDDEGDQTEEDDTEYEDIRYVSGNVTQPMCIEPGDAIIVHCVDNSGRWGRGGVFSALSSRSTEPERYYKKAGRMKDLSLGDVHVVPVDDIMCRDDGRDMLALIVCQSRDTSGHLSGIKFSALDVGLQKIGQLAKRKKASVHLPRIGHSTPHFNWYGTERLIRKHLASHGISTTIYYFPRHGRQNKPHIPKAPTSPPDDDTSADPLSNIFKGLVVYFNDDVPEDDITKYSRYIIAYDGRVESSGLTSDVTHVICGSQIPSQQSLEQVTMSTDGDVPRVSLSWLVDSLSKGQLQDIEGYKITQYS